MLRALALIAVVLPLFAGEPLPIEDVQFFPESGWNRNDAVLQYNAFFHGSGRAHELTQEWGDEGARHQFSFTVPVYSERSTGLGDVTLNYRRQLIGGAGSRLAIAPRVSLILPTRSPLFGIRSSGLQATVPLSISLTPRVTAHSSAGGTWFRDRHESEVNLTQSIGVSVTDRLSVALDGSWTRAGSGDEVLVVRPGVQYTFDGPDGLSITPGIAAPIGPDRRELLIFIALERPVAGKH